MPDHPHRPPAPSSDGAAPVWLRDLTLPELARIAVTALLFFVVLGLFLAMVRDVLIAGLLGAVIAIYLQPLHERLCGLVRHRGVAAFLTLTLVILPVLAVVVYSYVEARGVAEYLAQHSASVAAEIAAALERLPFVSAGSAEDTVRRGIERAAAAGLELPGMTSQAVGRVTVATAILLFTAFYVFTGKDEIVAYLRGKVPPRYGPLAEGLERNVRGVLYGAVYGTFVTQSAKAAIMFVLFFVFGVPLAGLLALVTFVIGFFPVVGSWTVYLPVAGYLLVFRDAPWAALAIVAGGFGLNTVFLSMLVRPKLAAEKSRVLNFYWMFVGLVAGVYSFGIAGILLGPLLIALLKAIIDTVTEREHWVHPDDGDGDDLQAEVLKEEKLGAAPLPEEPEPVGRAE